MFDREITKAFRLIRMKKRAINREMEAKFKGECRFIDWLNDEEGSPVWASLLVIPSERYFDDYPLLEGHCSMLLENNFLKELIIGLDRVRSGDNIDGSNELLKLASRCMTREELEDRSLHSNSYFLSKVLESIEKQLFSFFTTYSTGKYLLEDIRSDINRNRRIYFISSSQMLDLMNNWNGPLSAVGFYAPESIQRGLFELTCFTRCLARKLREVYPTEDMEIEIDEIRALLENQLSQMKSNGLSGIIASLKEDYV